MVPISARRARSQALNPHARPDDVAMLAAWEGARMIGYLGLLPAAIRNGETRARVSWISTIFVDPQRTGRGIGSTLVKYAAAIPLDLFTTLYLPRLRGPQIAAGLRPAGDLPHAVLDLRRAAPWNRAAAQAVRFAPFLSPVAAGLERVTGPPVRARVYRSLRHEMRGAERAWEPVPELPADAAPPPAAPVEFERGMPVLRWIVKNPWIVEAGAESSGEPRYHFSAVRDVFRYIPLRLSARAGGGDGWLLLCVTRSRGITQLRVLEHAVDDAAAGVAAVLEQGERHGADHLVVPESFAAVLGRVRAARPLLVRRRRPYMARVRPGGKAEAALPHVRWHFCDGDAAFV
ncbi:GNAT family N-acetyltransferase [Longimicrobium sp.]|uniref:GNAT family N-acetyltransferase n=1 Tax=Longimicrobium sp. TaxID=2029185 RepID=UPI002CB09B99|nr:GNAT family N-acetyltransferase [Longimicrobium sp.]HSU17082.1 GNAT family N-acetyltransferase [Longimicrobium sp.]